MLRVRILLLAAVLAATTLVVLAGPASAAKSPSSKFCTAVSKIGDNTSGKPTPEQAKKTYKQFKAAGKYAPAKVKKAANTIASFLSKLANVSPSNASELAGLYTSTNFRTYPKAVSTFFLYSARCGT
jgi:ribosomal protein L5